MAGERPALKESEVIERLAKPLTYFKDKKGFVYWSKGIVIPQTGRIIANLVYIPVPHSLANKIQASTGNYYLKRVVDYCNNDPPFDDLPPETKSHIDERKWENPITHARCVAVPPQDVTEIYGPRGALLIALNENRRHSETLYRLMEMFDQCGISSEQCGLYGGLQTGMHGLSSNDPRDIDVLLYGLDNFGKFQNIDAGLLEKFGFTRNDPTRRYTVDTFSDEHGTKIANRFIRSPEDPKTFPDDYFTNAGTETLFTGVVEDDNEAAAVSPTTYIVHSGERLLKVTTLAYRLIGAAFKNETVQVRGREVANNFVVLDYPHHQIALK